MTTIGFIGSGNIGSTVARLAVNAGYEVVLSNCRGAETLADVVEHLSPRARAATASEAAADGDIVVVTVPLRAYREVPADPLQGKVVIDTNNYYPDRDGHIPELDDKSTTTSKLLQQHLPKSQVVTIACSRPNSVSGMSVRPVWRPLRAHSVSPCRTRTRRWPLWSTSVSPRTSMSAPFLAA